MATTVVKQFVATIDSGTQINWHMTGVNPPLNKRGFQNAQPEWVVQWQAVPVAWRVDILDPKVHTAKPGVMVCDVTVVQEGDTSLTHIVPIACVDVGNNFFTPARFVLTYVLYAIFHDVP